MLIAGMEISLFILGGDIVRAYLLDYEIEEVRGGGPVTTMSISNIGPLQSADAVAIIAMNGTAGVLESRCPEGDAAVIGANVIVVSFVHMTPGIPCEIDVASDAAPPQLTQFTARGMPEAEVVDGWGRTHGGWNLVIFSIIAGQVFIAVFALWAYAVVLRSLYWFVRTHGYAKSRCADDIVEYVRREYGLKINHKRASVIESLAGGDGSPIRLARTLSLPPPYVRALLQSMRDSGILDDNGLDPALRECVENIRRRGGAAEGAGGARTG